MGKIDTITKEYMEDPVVFADAFNQFLYHGVQKIDSAMLTALDTTGIVVPYGADGTGVPEQKYRDVMKLLYALPVKNGVYDFLQLSHQVSEAARSHKKALKEAGAGAGQSNQTQEEEKPTDGEFLSGFWRSDRLVPVISLVIYFGPERWDAPLSLKEMYSDVDSVMLAHAPDYHVNLIAPGEMAVGEIDEFHSNLREVMLYIKYSGDKEKLSEIIEGDSRFQSMERQAAEVINVVTGSKLKYPEGKGDVNVCQAIKQMREESKLSGRIEGRIEGAVETYKDLDISLVETIKRIAERFQLSESESSEVVKQYW